MASPSNDQVQQMATRLAITYAESNVQLVSIGLQLFMCFYGLAVFTETKKALRQGRLPYILVSFIILALSIMSTIPSNFMNFKTVLNFVPGDPQRSRAAVERHGRGTPAYGVARVASTMIAFVGDGLLLSRCFFFWYDKKWVAILPAVVYAASVVMGLLQMLWQGAFPGWRIEFSVAWIILTAVLNVMITATISFRLLSAYHKNRELLPSSTSSTLYLSIVAILVEAALPLSVTGLVLACFINQTRGAGATQARQAFFRILYFFFLAISPQMIIFRVTTGRAAGHPRPMGIGNGAESTNITSGIDFGHVRSATTAEMDDLAETCSVRKARGEKYGAGGGETMHVDASKAGAGDV